MGKESKPQKTPKMTYFVNFYTGKKSKRTNKTPSRIEEFRACTLYSAMKQADATCEDEFEGEWIGEVFLLPPNATDDAVQVYPEQPLR